MPLFVIIDTEHLPSPNEYTMTPGVYVVNAATAEAACSDLAEHFKIDDPRHWHVADNKDVKKYKSVPNRSVTTDPAPGT